MRPLRELRFRSSPDIELKQLGDLAPEQREALRDLERDPDFYGLFVPRPPLSISLKSVTRPAAMLFQSLATPSRLNGAHLDDEDIIDLVLDGILEVWSGDRFVSGADAFSILCQPAASLEFRDAAARLSRDALLYAHDLETTDPSTLTRSLYLYNRLPLMPFWKTRFAVSDAFLAYLGADRAPLRGLLDREWIASRSVKGWLSWSSKMPLPPNESEVTYKLYISPHPDWIRDAFEIVVRVLADFPGAHFKIGAAAEGMLRPDKMVSYFTTRAQLGEAAEVLGRELAGCAAHGVPFTAGLDDSGLLSWGVDPPDNDRVLRWLGRDSWRLWVVKRLGAALSIGKSASGADVIEPWRFAIERARRHGIDVQTWTPSATLWSVA